MATGRLFLCDRELVIVVFRQILAGPITVSIAGIRKIKLETYANMINQLNISDDTVHTYTAGPYHDGGKTMIMIMGKSIVIMLAIVIMYAHSTLD